MSKLIRRKKEIGAALAVALQLTTLTLIGVIAHFTGGPQQSANAPADSQITANQTQNQNVQAPPATDRSSLRASAVYANKVYGSRATQIFDLATARAESAQRSTQQAQQAQQGELPNEATLISDQEDYPPYSYVYFHGTGFQPGETVDMIVVELDPVQQSFEPWQLEADENGEIFTSWYIFSPDFIGATLQATATGESSQFTASATFTDASGAGTMTVSPTSVSPGSTNNSFTFQFRAPNGVGNAYGAGSFATVVVPAGWTTPTTTSGQPGFVNATGVGTGTVTGPITVTGSGPWTVTVPFNASGTTNGFNLTYGVGAGAAVTAPCATGAYTFTTSTSQNGNPVAQVAPSPLVFDGISATLAAGAFGNSAGNLNSVVSNSVTANAGQTLLILVTAEDDSNGATRSASVANTSGANPLLVGSATLVTTNAGSSNSWVCSGNDCFFMYAFRATATGTSGTVTVTFPTAVKNAAVDVIALSGNNTSTPIGLTGINSGNSSSPNWNLSGTLTPGSSVLLFGDTTNFTATPPTWSTTPPNLFTQVDNFNEIDGARSHNLVNYFGAPSALPVSGSLSASARWGTIAIEILPATSPPPSCLPCTTPSVTTQPSPTQTVTYGAASASFSAAASGNPAPTVQWQVSTGGPFTDLANNATYSGVTTGTLTINNPTVSLSSSQYRAVFTNTCGGTHTVNSNAGTLTVTPRAVTVTADPKSKTYGDADPALTYQITTGSLVTGDSFSGALTRAAGESVGTHAILQGTLALNSNYTLTYVGANLTINTRAVTVTADAKSKTYGDADPALTYQITSGSLAFSDSFSGALTRAAGESVGTHAILQGTLALNSNYALTYIGANLTINLRAVTVTADAKSKVYGDADPTLTYQISSGSLATGDSFSGALTRAPGDGVGTYAILQGTLALNSNYTLTYNGANLTITLRDLTVTVDPKSKVYGDSDPALTYSHSALYSGDTDSVFTGSLTRAPGESVGLYAITQGSLTAGPNYHIIFTGANLQITPRSLTVTADAKTKVYGAVDPAFTYTHGTLYNSDTDSVFTGSLTRVAGDNVGTYAIQQGTLSAGLNYTIQFISANLTITPRDLTVTADPQSKIYGDSDPVFTYAHGTLYNGDTNSVFTGSLSRAAGESVGTYAITQGTLSAGLNYTIHFTGANLTIDPRAVTVTADAKSKTYGNADPALTYQITSGSLAFTDSFSGALSRAAGENVGTYAILQGTLSLSTNYTLTYVGANLTIDPRAVTVTADAKSKTYGNVDPALTYQITSGSLAFTDSFSGALSRAAGENVGTYAILQGTLSLSTNYTLTYVGANLTIDPRAVTVTADAKNKTYGNADPTLTYQITSGSLAFTDSFSGALSRAAGENVGTYAILQGTLSLSTNYTLTYVGANFTIDPRAVTVTADAKNKTYGNADPTLTYQITSGSLAFTDSFSGALSRVAGENVGTYAILQGTLSLSTNYTLTYVGANFTIDPRAVTVTADAKSKTYGNADPTLTYQITSGSLVTGDSFGGALSRVAGENVGTYAILQGTLSLSTNYTLTYVGANFTIDPRAVTVTADAKSKTYGNADPALTYQITSGSLAFSDTFAGALSRVAGENVGTYAIIQGTLSLNSNYTLTFVGADLTINHRAVTVTADAKSKTYGDADPTLTYQITSGSLAFSDTFAGALSRVAGENVGTYAIIQGSLALNSNYTLTYIGANLSITPATLTITADHKSKTYGAADPALTYQASGFQFSDTVATVLTGGLARNPGENVGSYNITQGTLAANGNYTISFTGNTLTITAAVLSITADHQTKTYGAADPALTYQASGFQFSDTAATVLTGGLARDPGENVGSYGITQGTLVANANYTISFTGNDLQIDPATLGITADHQTKTYGAADPALTYQASGFQFGDTAATVLTGALTRAGGESVGSYAITQGTLAVTTANYTISFTGNDLQIDPATLTITVDHQTKTYGQADPTLTYQASGFQFSDTAATVLTGALARAAGENVGSYAIMQGTLAANANYTISFIGNTLAISPAGLTITADHRTKTYGAADPTLTYQASGFQFSDTAATVLTGALARAAGENVGSYAIMQGTLAANANYTISFTGNTLSITTATLTITADHRTKTYGAADPALTYQATGFQFSDTAATVLTGALTRAVGENVGNYNITQGTLSANANYTISFTGNTLSITPATLTITADHKSKVYGNADPALTYQASGFQFSDTAATVLTGALTRAVGENAGNYNITQGTLSANANYAISFTGDTLTITQRPATWTTNPNSKVYAASDPNPLTTGSGSGFLAADAPLITATYSRVAGESASPPTYHITATLSPAGVLSNYSVTNNGAEFTISHWTTGGFYQPVDMNGVINTVKGGSTVPLKFNIYAGNVERTSVSDVMYQSVQVFEYGCTSGPEDPIGDINTGATALRYDTTGHQFIQNWQTPKPPNKCYRVRMTAIDGSYIEALFKTK